ncbi:MAG: PA14 domain-containing protein [Myxococcota bacterium]
MSPNHPAILTLTGFFALASAGGCSFEASGETRASGGATTTSGSERAESEPPPRAREPRRTRRQRRRGRAARHRYARRRPVPPPEGAPKETVFGSTQPKERALQGNIYFLPENTRKLPDFDEIEPTGTVYADEIDIPKRRFEEGFPGIDERFEWFGVVYTGTFDVTKAGEHEFRLLSDDGSKLWIDGELIIDNDGQHPPEDKTGSIELEAGEHEIVVEYFQGPRHHIALQLFMTPPGGEETLFSVK